MIWHILGILAFVVIYKFENYFVYLQKCVKLLTYNLLTSDIKIIDVRCLKSEGWCKMSEGSLTKVRVWHAMM